MQNHKNRAPTQKSQFFPFFIESTPPLVSVHLIGTTIYLDVIISRAISIVEFSSSLILQFTIIAILREKLRHFRINFASGVSTKKFLLVREALVRKKKEQLVKYAESIYLRHFVVYAKVRGFISSNPPFRSIATSFLARSKLKRLFYTQYNARRMARARDCVTLFYVYKHVLLQGYGTFGHPFPSPQCFTVSFSIVTRRLVSPSMFRACGRNV